MTRFKAGKTYLDRDYNNYIVIERTPKRITVIDDLNRMKTIGVNLDDEGNEIAHPDGKYSGAYVIRSNRTLCKGKYPFQKV